MEFSDHEHLKSQQTEGCSVKCLSLPVPVKLSGRSHFHLYDCCWDMNFLNELPECPWIKTLTKTVGDLSKLEVQNQAFFLQIPLDLEFCFTLSFFHKRTNLNFLLVCHRGGRKHLALILSKIIIKCILRKLELQRNTLQILWLQRNSSNSSELL